MYIYLKVGKLAHNLEGMISRHAFLLTFMIPQLSFAHIHCTLETESYIHLPLSNFGTLELMFTRNLQLIRTPIFSRYTIAHPTLNVDSLFSHQLLFEAVP